MEPFPCGNGSCSDIFNRYRSSALERVRLPASILYHIFYIFLHIFQNFYANPQKGFTFIRYTLNVIEANIIAFIFSSTPANQSLGSSIYSAMYFQAQKKHETGFEPATLALARRYSTTEPLVHNKLFSSTLRPSARLENTSPSVGNTSPLNSKTPR